MQLKQRHNIRLEEPGHRYFVDDVPKPGLTSILSPLNNFDGIPAGVLEKAAKRGTDLHLMIHYAIKDTLDISSLTPDQRPILDGFYIWTIQAGVKLSDCHSEIRMYHDKLDLCCTADLLIGDEIFEMKFGQIKDLYVGAQLAGQAEMFENNFGIKIKAKHALFPDDKGVFKTKPYKDKNDYRIFRCMLDYHININRSRANIENQIMHRQGFINQLKEK